MKRENDIERMVTGVLARRSADVARAISLAEDRRQIAGPLTIALLRELSARGRPSVCHRVGITGPPGVGKSSLVNAVARQYRARGRSVGVLAVDPSSPRSGGALLGDRARIQVDPKDTDLYVRSMAAGGQLGGLARAAGAAVEILSAAFDVVIVETTGVGQSETDVEHVTDSVVLVIQPASGDVLQFIKAGILEIPDLLVVNKSDLGAVAERATAELGAALGALFEGSRRQRPPVLSTSATTGEGLPKLVDAIEAHHAWLEQENELLPRRMHKAAAWAARLFLTRFGEVGAERFGGARKLEAELLTHIRAGSSTLEAIAQLAPE